MPSVKCVVVLAAANPKVYRAEYYPDECTGTYGKMRKTNSFAVPDDVKPSINLYRGLRATPFFVVDPKTGLAQPVGKSMCNDPLLATKIEVAAQKKYVKAMTVRVFDLVQMLILMAAGGGLILYSLHLISAFTGNAITL